MLTLVLLHDSVSPDDTLPRLNDNTSELTRSREPDVSFACGRVEEILIFTPIFAIYENWSEKETTYRSAEGEKAN